MFKLVMPYKYYYFFFIVNFILTEKSVTYSSSIRQDCKCGWHTDIDFRIVGGHESELTTHPWMAGIFHPIKKKFFCGGSLINDRYIVTAAHCLKLVRKKKPFVVLGMQNKTLFEETKKGGTLFEVEEIIEHEDHSTILFYDVNDIALLKLKEKVVFNEKINPICLPTNPDEDYANEIANVMGWGKIEYEGESSPSLQEVEVSVLSHLECKKKDPIGQHIKDIMICAIGNDTDACQGDSGGPLIIEKKLGKAELIGIVSWGIGCANPGVPGVYTRVTKYLYWIAKHTSDASYCKSH